MTSLATNTAAPVVEEQSNSEVSGSSGKSWLASTKATNIATFIAIVVAFFGIWKTSADQGNALQKQIDFSAEEAANSAWISYREVEERFLRESTETEINEMKPQELKLYHLTVERMMMSADIVTYSLDKDKQWEGAFAIEFQNHKDFILSPHFLEEKGGQISEFCTYRHPVHLWIERAFETDPQASQAIAAAHAICERHLDSQGYSDLRGEPK